MTIASLIWICWGIFCIVWVIGGVYNSFKAQKTHKIHFRYDTPVFVLIAVLLRTLLYPYLKTITFNAIWLQDVGIVLFIISILFTLWSRWTLGKMWSDNAQIKIEHQLITKGPYQITRNPIYTGIFGMLLGTTLMLGESWFCIILVVILILFIIRIHNEEKLLSETFGEQYDHYKKRVPQFIPFFKFKSRHN